MFVLIHSPLVGPTTWSLVAGAMQRQGVGSVVPVLTSPPALDTLYWERHVTEVRRAVTSRRRRSPLILVAHSGSGPLLPAIGQGLAPSVAAYIFVDAGFPEEGKSRLDLFESPEGAAQFRGAASAGMLPVWTEEALRESIVAPAVRHRFAAELRPVPLAVYEEPLPVGDNWPDAPCAYLRFGANPAYDRSAMLAQRRGWLFRTLEGGHFLMLDEPEQVAVALLDLAHRLTGSAPR